MDGFFLAIFLAVCVVLALVLRFICTRYCLVRCSKKRRNRSDGSVILPVTRAPTIIPAANRRPMQMIRPTTVEIPDDHTFSLPSPESVYTIYTFPQQGSPELLRPLSPSERQFTISSLSPVSTNQSDFPEDLPPKYEDLFPQQDEFKHMLPSNDLVEKIDLNKS